MQLTEKTKKILIVTVVALVAIHFLLPRIMNAIHAANAPAVLPKPSPARYAPVQSPAPPPSPEVVASIRYGGIWEGDTLQPDGNRCAIHLEIRLNDDLPKKLKGYSTVRCMPLQTLARGPVSRGQDNEMVRDYAAPATAVMTAAPQSGGLTFTIDPNSVPASNGCSITGFNLTDFGQGQVFADWQEGTCQPGRMLLRKTRG